jgi:putative transposase
VLNLCYRDVDELLTTKGIQIDHGKLQRWGVTFTHLMETSFSKRKKPVGNSWRMDESCIKVKGEWMYLYRAFDKEGSTIDFLRTKRRNKFAAHKFLSKAMLNNGYPEVINIDKSGANKEAIKTYKKLSEREINLLRRTFFFGKGLYQGYNCLQAPGGVLIMPSYQCPAARKVVITDASIFINHY